MIPQPHAASAPHHPEPHLCGCQAPPDRFVEMILALAERLDRLDDGAWTQLRRFTQRFHWACSAAAAQQEAFAWLSGGDTPVQAAIGAEIGARDSIAESCAESFPRESGGPEPSSVAPATLDPRFRGGTGGGTERDRSKHADGPIVLRGGRIFTADPATPWVEALRIEGERIVAMGRDAEIDTGGARVIELGGRLAIPGFNDAHMHHTPDPAGIRLPVDPVADPDLAALAPLIAEAVATSPPGTWIMATMGDAITNDARVHRDALDALAPDHPLILLGFTNHRLILNGAALARLGVNEQAVNPVGGAFHRYPESGRLNGRVDEYAMWGPQRLFAAMASVDEGAASIAALGAEAARMGITTLQNMSWTPIDRYLEMLAAADFPIRMRLIHFPPAGPAGRVIEPAVRSTPDHVTVHGTKWILDGTPVERSAALGRPYADAPETAGALNFSDGAVLAMIAERGRGQVLLHAIGGAAIDQVLEGLEAAGAGGVRMEHGDDLSPDQVERMVALGLPLAINPCHLLMPHFFRPRLGDTELVGAIGTLHERGVALSIGSDGPLSPFISLLGAVYNPVAPDRALSLTDALIAYTHGGACAEGAGDEKGRLTPGYLADLAVLSGDLFALPPDAWPGVASLLTIVGGAIVHQDAALTAAAA